MVSGFVSNYIIVGSSMMGQGWSSLFYSGVANDGLFVSIFGFDHKGFKGFDLDLHLAMFKGFDFGVQNLHECSVWSSHRTQIWKRG